MKTKNDDLIRQNKVFLWLAIGTLVLLAVPWLLMNFKVPLYDPGSGYEIINWDLTDFIVMGTLIFAISSLFVLAARKFRMSRQRVILASVLLFAFLYLWAELAVGIFTNWGS